MGIIGLLTVAGCAGRKERQARARLREQVKQVVKEEAPTASVRISGGKFRVEDTQGRPVLVAQVRDVNALIQPGGPSRGPLTLHQADLILYKDGKPSLWLKAPVATWQDGVLRAGAKGRAGGPGVRGGSVDGKMAVEGKSATWTAKPNLLAVADARCELREAGQPPLQARGPEADWQSGLLTMPSGVTAKAADRSASMRADRLRWRSTTHGLEATGRVRMTRGRLAGHAERLAGDTVLRRFRLSGGRPRVTFYPQPAPLVVAEADRRNRVIRSRSSFRPALIGGAALLAAALLPAARAEARTVYRSSNMEVAADEIQGDPTVVHAIGNVVLTGSQGVLRADRVDVTQAADHPSGGAPTPGASRSAVREARATGNVRITSQPKPDERIEATGAAGTFWPGTQKAALTGGVTVTMTSPQLQEPAVLTGARAEIDLAKHTVEVVRTPEAQVALRLKPKAAAAPIRLDADRVLMDNQANRIIATGSPVLTSENGTVRAERIWFDIDPKAKDVKLVHAEGGVQVDAQEQQGGHFHATARQAVLDRAADTVVLTGNVEGKRTVPDEPQPETIVADELTYNLKTRAYHAGAAGQHRVRATFRPKPRQQGTK